MAISCVEGGAEAASRNAKHSTFINTLSLTLARKLDVSYNIVHIRRRLLLIFDHGLSETLQDLLIC